jgi:type I restriction enzyme M protein
VDLPVEAFLPQVGVQASLLFLQKLNRAEQSLLREPDAHTRDYQVFMAIAEKVGKDRRGNRVYERDEDGKEVFSRTTVETLAIDTNKNLVVRKREETSLTLNDDLPKIAVAYKAFLKTK